MLRRWICLALLVGVLSGCNPAFVPQAALEDEEKRAAPAAQQVASVNVAAVLPTADAPAVTVVPAALAPTATTTAAAAEPAAEAAAPAAFGPDEYPQGVSPLSGLPVGDPDNLDLIPALVSVTNFPPSARPQAGLSYSPYVFEMYIGEGMTRFLAVFYGDYPKKDEDKGISLDDDRIGPVRSGRLPYESLRKLYNGFLVMSSASSVVLPSLGEYTTVFGEDNGDINSNMIPATRLEEIAGKTSKRLEPAALSGQRFEALVPAGGQLGKMIWIPYSFLNQVLWRYDPQSGAYHRYQDNADGETFIQATDRLNGQPLTYENVVILFADHHARRETLIDIDLMYITRKPALLFRDGKVYPIFWTTANTEYEKQTGKVRPIRFIDADGDPFPLKPGQTWVQIVQDHTRYNETVDSEVYFDLKNKEQLGSGNWAIHFFPTVAER